MQIEEWKEITNCPGYFVSSFGNVIGARFPIYYKTSLSRKGYPTVRIPKFKYSKPLHRVVAHHFIGASSLQVNHKDGNKLNNHVSNLEYVTCKENIRHAIQLGLRSATINLRSNAMFDDFQLGVIRGAIKFGYTNPQIAKYFGCDHSTISKIRRGKHYASAL